MVVKTKDGIGIIDFKTAKSKYSEIDIETDSQVSAYLWAAKKLGFNVSWFMFEVLLKYFKPEIIRYETHRTDRALQKFEEMVKKMIKGVKEGIFYPRTGWQCQSCPFRNRCFTEHGIKLVSQDTKILSGAHV